MEQTNAQTKYCKAEYKEITWIKKENIMTEMGAKMNKDKEERTWEVF